MILSSKQLLAVSRMAQTGGLEPPRTVLETVMLPITSDPYINRGRVKFCQKASPPLNRNHHRSTLAGVRLLRVVRYLRRATVSKTRKPWGCQRDLNPRPADYKSAALPTELRQHKNFFPYFYIRKSPFFQIDPPYPSGDDLLKRFGQSLGVLKRFR